MGSRSRPPRPIRALVALVAVAIVALALPASATSGWTILASANPTTAQNSYLTGVSCTAASTKSTTVNCVAVGNYNTETGDVHALTERLTGTKWAVVANPERADSAVNTLDAASCTSAKFCVAVGNSRKIATSPALTLIERWNGTSWIKMVSPNVANATGTYLNGVSCVATTTCFAVGTVTAKGGAPATLAERWNGKTWKIVRTPNHAGAASNALTGVSCTAAHSSVNCYAVGSWSPSADGTPYNTLIERWSGSSWTIVKSPNHGGDHRSAFNAVSCTSSTHCVAVGFYEHAPGATFIAQLSGAHWASVKNPNPRSIFSTFNAVSCAGTTSCDAVGLYSADGLTHQTLIEHWNGNRWTIVSSPNPLKSVGSSFAAVSCTKGCLAVGTFAQTTFGNHSATLTERRG